MEVPTFICPWLRTYCGGGGGGGLEASVGGCSCWSNHGGPTNTAVCLSQQAQMAPREMGWDAPGEDRLLQGPHLCRVWSRVILEV